MVRETFLKMHSQKVRFTGGQKKHKEKYKMKITFVPSLVYSQRVTMLSF